jgi:hypothetical protein
MEQIPPNKLLNQNRIKFKEAQFETTVLVQLPVGKNL